MTLIFLELDLADMAKRALIVWETLSIPPTVSHPILVLPIGVHGLDVPPLVDTDTW